MNELSQALDDVRRALAEGSETVTDGPVTVHVTGTGQVTVLIEGKATLAERVTALIATARTERWRRAEAMLDTVSADPRVAAVTQQLIDTADQPLAPAPQVRPAPPTIDDDDDWQADPERVRRMLRGD